MFKILILTLAFPLCTIKPLSSMTVISFIATCGHLWRKGWFRQNNHSDADVIQSILTWSVSFCFSCMWVIMEPLHTIQMGINVGVNGCMFRACFSAQAFSCRGSLFSCTRRCVQLPQHEHRWDFNGNAAARVHVTASRIPFIQQEFPWHRHTEHSRIMFIQYKCGCASRFQLL